MTSPVSALTTALKETRRLSFDPVGVLEPDASGGVVSGWA